MPYKKSDIFLFLQFILRNLENEKFNYHSNTGSVDGDIKILQEQFKYIFENYKTEKALNAAAKKNSFFQKFKNEKNTEIKFVVDLWTGTLQIEIKSLANGQKDLIELLKGHWGVLDNYSPFFKNVKFFFHESENMWNTYKFILQHIKEQNLKAYSIQDFQLQGVQRTIENIDYITRPIFENQETVKYLNEKLVENNLEGRFYLNWQGDLLYLYEKPPIVQAPESFYNRYFEAYKD